MQVPGGLLRGGGAGLGQQGQGPSHTQGQGAAPGRGEGEREAEEEDAKGNPRGPLPATPPRSWSRAPLTPTLQKPTLVVPIRAPRKELKSRARWRKSPALSMLPLSIRRRSQVQQRRLNPNLQCTKLVTQGSLGR